MTDDIVDTLRVLNHHAKKLAENESLNDLHRDAFTRCEDLTWQASDEIERLRKERDDARCDACMTWAWMYRPSENAETEARKEAKRRGWDCYRGEDSDDL